MPLVPQVRVGVALNIPYHIKYVIAKPFMQKENFRVRVLLIFVTHGTLDSACDYWYDWDFEGPRGLWYCGRQ